MANHKSAEKRARQSLKRRACNTSTKSAVRTAEKTLRTAIAEKNFEKAEAQLKNFNSKIAKAAQKGVFHFKTVARKVSRLSVQVSQLSK